MASTLFSFVFCIIFIALTGFGSAAALRVEVETKPSIESPDELNVTCRTDESFDSSKTILIIEISKQDEDKSIVSINSKQHLAMGNGFKDYMKAEGILDNAANKGHLTLTLVKPTEIDTGIYGCQIFYWSEQTRIESDKATVSVTVHEQNTTDIASNLVSIVSTLMKTVKEQEEINSQQNDKIKNQDQELDILKSLLIRQNETLQRLESYHSCPEGWKHDKKDNTCLKAFGTLNHRERFSWFNARNECQVLGGNLVQIRDERKNTFVDDVIGFSPLRFVWIGVWNVANDGLGFKYADGTPLGSYHPWLDVKSIKDGEGKCAYMFEGQGFDQEWDIGNCEHKYQFVCSIPFHRT